MKKQPKKREQVFSELMFTPDSVERIHLTYEQAGQVEAFAERLLDASRRVRRAENIRRQAAAEREKEAQEARDRIELARRQQVLQPRLDRFAGALYQLSAAHQLGIEVNPGAFQIWDLEPKGYGTFGFLPTLRELRHRAKKAKRRTGPKRAPKRKPKVTPSAKPSSKRR